MFEVFEEGEEDLSALHSQVLTIEDKPDPALP
jgi:hypothetical protein